VAFGPGDDVVIPIHLQSRRADAVKVSRLDFSLKEVLTLKGDLKTGAQATQKVSLLFNVRSAADIPLYTGEEHRFELKGPISPAYERVTTNGRHISIAYFARVAVTLERTTGSAPDDLETLELDGIPVTLGSQSTDQATGLKDKILQATEGKTPAYLDVPLGSIMPALSERSNSCAEFDRSTRQSISEFRSPSETTSEHGAFQRRSSQGRSLVDDAKARLNARRQSSGPRITNPDEDSTTASVGRDARSEKDALKARYAQETAATSAMAPVLPVTVSQPSTAASGQTSAQNAEEEKVRLYNAAQTLVEAQHRTMNEPLPNQYATAASEKQRHFTAASHNPQLGWSASGAKEEQAVSACEFSLWRKNSNDMLSR
jgi:hypothetical protein